MYEIVLDTNVLMTPLRSRRGASFQLIRRVDEGEFRLIISVALALEYEEVLKQTDLLPGFSEADIDKFLDYLFQVSTLVPSVVPLRPNLRNPHDEFVLDGFARITGSDAPATRQTDVGQLAGALS